MHLKRLPSIAATEIGVKNHLVVEKVRVKIAGALEVCYRCAELAEQRCCSLVAD